MAIVDYTTAQIRNVARVIRALYEGEMDAQARQGNMDVAKVYSRMAATVDPFARVYTEAQVRTAANLAVSSVTEAVRNQAYPGDQTALHLETALVRLNTELAARFG